MFTCEIDGLADLERDWADAMGALADGVNRGVERGITDGIAQAKSSHAYKDHTGGLTGSLRAYMERSAARLAGGEAIGVMMADAKYASYVEEGTEAHDIRPKAGVDDIGPTRPGQGRHALADAKKGETQEHKRKALRWESGGEVRFAHHVHHPGGRPYPYLGPAVQKAERVIEVEIAIAEERAAQIMSR